jgi:outer membrane lipoprotein SlyB
MLAVRKRNILVVFLTMVLVLFSVAPSGFAREHRYRAHRTYVYHHHSKVKGALIGGAAGLGIGALAGGRKGALIGGAAGAGTGALVQHYRNRRHRD